MHNKGRKFAQKLQIEKKKKKDMCTKQIKNMLQLNNSTKIAFPGKDK